MRGHFRSVSVFALPMMPLLQVQAVPAQGKKPFVEMQAEATGIHRDGPSAKPKYFLFNIGWSRFED